ncbi:hypothetical protein CC80DRAFT_520587 [Byssothecium circinans]|uniref:Zn(2)-C6 fungal-type domain-containing protein n=1 Tax=Byssothecium circinans TaxID=147558 RepID=A0A6A5TK75_9PLEO|nr:hypothetical protein CC80DRAFT_520587 [Byssothecium circinans]
MTTDLRTRSALTEGLSAGGKWEDLVAWDGEDLQDSFFNDFNFTGMEQEVDLTSGRLQAPAHITFNQLHAPLSATSFVEGPLSDYAVSAPPSINEGGPSSLDHGKSWLSASPSYTTTATSPFVGKDGPLLSSSFDACEDTLSPFRTFTASPLFDAQSFGSSSSYHTAAAPAIFNPYLTGSLHSFSGLDVSASQEFSNVGTWGEPSPQGQGFQDDFFTSQGIETIPESFSNTFSPHPWGATSQEQQPLPTSEQTRPRAIEIPRSQTQRPPPLLSVSPETRRLPRSVLLSRSASSKSEPRRSRKGTPSPTTNELGWVSYQPHAQTHRLVPSTDGSRGRRSRGRVGPMTLEQRSHAALMRRAGSCYNCRKRKERCDPGIPCQACLDYYKADLTHQPCRDIRIADLHSAFLSERLGWHPTDRSINSFLEPHGYHISTDFAYRIGLNFGFGPRLQLPVHAIEVFNSEAPLCHDHIIYSWPPSATCFQKHTHAVLPAVLTPEAKFNLQTTLDDHLALLVQQHFQFFPLYCSPLRILRDIYILYRTLSSRTASSRLLLQALKLLVLVHIGGDITLSTTSTDTDLEHLIGDTMSLPEPVTPTPCFIRSQFGAIMPTLAARLMKEVLSSLEHLFLNREPHEWPIALATLLVVLITVESIQYHAAKLPYHQSYDAGPSQSRQENDSKGDDEEVKKLLAFYSACFSSCHARLKPDWKGDAAQSRGMGGAGISPEDKFVDNVREAIVRAEDEQGGYLVKKADGERVGDDMAFFFDRLAARVLVLRT